MHLLTDLPLRMRERIHVAENGCWEIPVAYGGDYSWMQPLWGGKPKPSHRVLYELLVAPIELPHLHHKCDNKICVNPDHLVPMSTSDHSKITDRFKRFPKCERGHKATTFMVDGKPYCRVCVKNDAKALAQSRRTDD